jgi:hypothetical protein
MILPSIFKFQDVFFDFFLPPSGFSALVMALLGSVFTMLVVGSGEHFTYTSAVDFSTLAI